MNGPVVSDRNASTTEIPRGASICFTGSFVDGSGKSTLSNITYKKILKERKIIKKYGRFIPICTKIVIFLGRKIFKKFNIYTKKL